MNHYDLSIGDTANATSTDSWENQSPEIGWVGIVEPWSLRKIPKKCLKRAFTNHNRILSATRSSFDIIAWLSSLTIHIEICGFWHTEEVWTNRFFFTHIKWDWPGKVFDLALLFRYFYGLASVNHPPTQVAIVFFRCFACPPLRVCWCCSTCYTKNHPKRIFENVFCVNLHVLFLFDPSPVRVSVWKSRPP